MKQLLSSYEKSHVAELVANLERLGYATLFPVQRLALTLTSGTAFLQSPCGSGKTLACLLPHLVRNEPETVVFVALNQRLQYQVEQLITKLIANLERFSLVFALDVIARPVPQNKTVFTVTTPGALQTFLLENKLQPGCPVTLVVDEADAQIRGQPLLFNKLFGQLQSGSGYATNSSAFAKRHSTSDLSVVFCSATLRSSEHLFNNLRVQPGVFLQVDEQTARRSYKAVNSRRGFEALYLLLHEAKMPLPTIVFFEDLQKLGEAAMDLLKIQSEEPFVLNVIAEDYKSIQSDFLCVNSSETTTNSVIFTTNECARGLDIPLLKSAVSIGYCEPENLVHRLGRAGRGDGEAVCYVVSEQNHCATLSQLGQIQVFESHEVFIEEELGECKETCKRLEDFSKWKKEADQGISFQQFIEGL